ncbi:hypothetical protein, partial [Halapricum sp. CBA1109]|uniref:hypothetical protein n=1 Tax=Halapricum sp. CBA1109 TaxID=2668068 RepID=UPI00351AF951
RPIDVTVREDLTVGQLARELATPTDFLHYIGHCENGGLRCPDGTLSTAELARSRTRTSSSTPVAPTTRVSTSSRPAVWPER